MYVCLVVFVLLVLLSNLRCRGKVHNARREAWVARQCTEGYKRRLNEHMERGNAREALLLTEIGSVALDYAKAAVERDAWKSYALGYEVLCESVSDGDIDGALNARTEIVSSRDILLVLGQYDA
jgi:hypothetical protein